MAAVLPACHGRARRRASAGRRCLLLRCRCGNPSGSAASRRWRWRRRRQRRWPSWGPVGPQTCQVLLRQTQVRGSIAAQPRIQSTGAVPTAASAGQRAALPRCCHAVPAASCTGTQAAPPAPPCPSLPWPARLARLHAEASGLLDLEDYFRLAGQDVSGAVHTGAARRARALPARLQPVPTVPAASSAPPPRTCTHHPTQPNPASPLAAPCVWPRWPLPRVGQPRGLRAIRHSARPRRRLGGRRRRQVQLQDRQEGWAGKPGLRMRRLHARPWAACSSIACWPVFACCAGRQRMRARPG